MKERYIVSLGGSLIVPDQIDDRFLSGFKKIIEQQVKLGKRFLIITGGGKTARRYAQSARALKALNRTDLDWLGIHSTRLNGHLLRTVFRKYAHPRIITNPHRTEKAKEAIVIAAGYRPGWSTDYVAVLLAKKFGINTILNLSNTDYVYDKDPRKFRNAKAYKKISWHDFRKLVGNKWDPGANVPFDPVASKLAQKLRIKVVTLNGKSLSNLGNFLENKSFKGTVIS